MMMVTMTMTMMTMLMTMTMTLMLNTLAQLDVCERLGAREGKDESSKDDFEEEPPQ